MRMEDFRSSSRSLVKLSFERPIHNPPTSEGSTTLPRRNFNGFAIFK